MGIYLNPGSTNFEESIHSDIYIDKSLLIAFTNKKIKTTGKYLCVSRPRRFGKSMAADMLAAYYGWGEDSRSVFKNMKIEQDDSFEKHLNQYQVIKIDMQSFMSEARSVAEMITNLESEIIQELLYYFPDVFVLNKKKLNRVMNGIFQDTGDRFVILIDEWDCVMRRYHNQEEQKLYLDFLRNLMKDQPYIALAYMTGILPIKKYGEHSALNMFYEYSMIDSADISDCFGFTEEEVRGLCERFGMDFEEAKDWYDGYHMVSHPLGDRREYSVYSPKSVSEAMMRKKYRAYWNQTENYEALKDYIQMNFDGLKDAVVEMLAGEKVPIETESFQNDMMNFHNKNDVMTLLVHLGYLTYDQDYETVSIPNKEVSKEFVASIKNMESWSEVAASIQDSRKLLQDLWNMDGASVAAGVEKSHMETSVLKYHDENSLSCVISLAFYYAREYYTIVREMPSGKGFADLCFIPKPNHQDKPAIIIELKYHKSAESALNQIKEKKYPEILKAYSGDILLCGINYDDEKKHTCVIERWRISRK